MSSYPESRRWLDTIFDGVPPAIRRKVLVETPCAFFHLDDKAELTKTPAR